MPRSLFIPSEEDTQIELNFPNSDKQPVTVDVFDLEDIFVKASDRAKEMGTHWKNQVPPLAKKKLGVDISPTQSALLYGAVQAQIADIKKKLSVESKT